MNDTRNNMKKEKNQHIQVFVRVRPINNAEKTGKSMTVVEVPSNREIVVHEKALDKFSKKFTFDKVFGPQSKQVDVYNAVVSPLIEEVLAGYNCTVFAYGQTGTGKTYTMEGVGSDPSIHWSTDTHAGIIPRSLSHLFDQLKMTGGPEFTVRVTFLELYNEEIFDLLSPNHDSSKIRLYEDSSKKGVVVIHGLEEVTVHSKDEVYKILEKGSEKRQTASTLMNAQSSRSHTVFSVTIHIKESTIEGEELLKTGKLNLVDLAGSENIGRSGAVDRRAREAGSINQSLLTLGRVITALVERTPHVPYRESKLTRILQESLGGRTKTSIIATISPASVNLEETLSTLDYAHRAKNITNRPEINQKLSKKALLQEYTEEIERLKRDLFATRERNGVYLAQDNYTEMQYLIEEQNKEIEEKLNHIKALQDALETKQKLFSELETKHTEQANDLLSSKKQLEVIEDDLKAKTTCLEEIELARDEQKHLVDKHMSTKTMLLSQAETLLNVADTATADATKLHDKIYRKIQVEQTNKNLAQKFRRDTAKQITDIENDVSEYIQDLTQFCAFMKDQSDTQIQFHKKIVDQSIQDISVNLTNSEKMMSTELTNSLNEKNSEYQEWLEKEIESTAHMTDREIAALTNISSKLAPKIQDIVQNKIAENLRVVNNDVSKRIDHLLAYTQRSITTICNYGVDEQNRLLASTQELKENIQNCLQSQNGVVERRKNFEKVMKGVQNRFDDLCKRDELHYFDMCDTLNRVTEVTNDINDTKLSTCNTSIEKGKSLQKMIEDDVKAVRVRVTNDMEECCSIAEDTAVQSGILIKEFQSEVCKSCDALENNKKLKEQKAKEMQRKLDGDKHSILVSINDMDSMICKGGADHVMCLEAQNIHSSNAFTELDKTIEIQNKNAEKFKEQICNELHTVRDKLDEFFTEGLHRDVPTGATPVKKNYQYSRELAKLSPHERILKKFRESRNNVETLSDEASM